MSVDFNFSNGRTSQKQDFFRQKPEAFPMHASVTSHKVQATC